MAYARPLQGRRQMPMDGEQKQICRFFVKTGVCTRYKSKLIINVKKFYEIFRFHEIFWK